MSSAAGAGPRRPARRQVAAAVTGHEESHAPGTVNIWTGRVLKEFRKPKEGRRKEASQYRCLPKADTGETRGSAAGAAYCCLYFARGICHHGADCNFLHRLPTAADEERHKTDYSHDIFGRERAPAAWDSRKKGVGSYERECTTLYAHYGGAGTLPTEQLRKIVADNFAEWGPLDSVHLVPAKTIAFVRYQWRSSAEFAKAAMHQQTLRGCDTTEVLDVRWANDDPNPRTVARVQHEREVALRDAYVKAVNELAPDAKRARIQQLHLAATVRPGAASAAYPDTDAQYGGPVGAGGYRHNYEGWDSFLYQQQQQGGSAGGPAAAAADAPQDEAAQWAAWQQWHAQHPGGHYPPGSAGGPAGGGVDDYTRYLRPEDYWALPKPEQHQQQQQGAKEGAAARAAGGAAAAADAQQQGGSDEAGADAVAQEALGLLGGYGSGSDSQDEEGGSGGKGGGGGDEGSGGEKGG